MDLLLGCHWNGPVCLQPAPRPLGVQQVCAEFSPGATCTDHTSMVPCIRRECAEGLGSEVQRCRFLGLGTGLNQVTEPCLEYPPHVIQHSLPPRSLLANTKRGEPGTLQGGSSRSSSLFLHLFPSLPASCHNISFSPIIFIPLDCRELFKFSFSVLIFLSH